MRRAHQRNSLMAGVVTLLWLSATASAQSLEQHQWQNRPLLVFTPSVHDERARHTLELVEQRRCWLQDRDMVVGIVPAQGRAILDHQPLTIEETQSLRARHRVSMDEFIVVLIGKDGGEKFRTQQIPDLDEIFHLIDGMPMRIQEVQQSDADCR